MSCSNNDFQCISFLWYPCLYQRISFIGTWLYHVSLSLLPMFVPTTALVNYGQRRESGQVDHWELMVEDALGRLTEEERRQKKMNGPYRELSMNRGTEQVHDSPPCPCLQRMNEMHVFLYLHVRYGWVLRVLRVSLCSSMSPRNRPGQSCMSLTRSSLPPPNSISRPHPRLLLSISISSSPHLTHSHISHTPTRRMQ